MPKSRLEDCQIVRDRSHFAHLLKEAPSFALLHKKESNAQLFWISESVLLSVILKGFVFLLICIMALTGGLNLIKSGDSKLEPYIKLSMFSQLSLKDQILSSIKAFKSRIRSQSSISEKPTAQKETQVTGLTVQFKFGSKSSIRQHNFVDYRWAASVRNQECEENSTDATNKVTEFPEGHGYSGML